MTTGKLLGSVATSVRAHALVLGSALLAFAACSDGGGQTAHDAAAEAATATPDAARPPVDGSTVDVGAVDSATKDLGQPLDVGIDAGADAKPPVVLDSGLDGTRVLDAIADLSIDASLADALKADAPLSLDQGGLVYDVPPADTSLASPDLPPIVVDATASEAGLPGLCELRFAASTANLVSSSSPLTNDCAAVEFDDSAGKPAQWNFGADDTVTATMRAFNIDWFDVTSPAGTALKVEDGYDITGTPWKGINVSYMESGSNGDTYSWTGDKGLVTLLAINGKTFTVLLTGVHFSPMDDPFGQNKATGGFEMSGTITADLKIVK
jgi:hypothetical protein